MAHAARDKAGQAAVKLRKMRLRRDAEIVEARIDETLTDYAMPTEHWRSLRTNNPLERLTREIRRRTRVVGSFPNEKSADAGGSKASHVSSYKTRKSWTLPAPTVTLPSRPFRLPRCQV